MKIRVLTNVRHDTAFLRLWVAYYGTLFGRENLHIFIDGDDWQSSVDLSGVNLHVKTDIPRLRHQMDGALAWHQFRFSRELLGSGTDVILRTDVDEFLAADPETGLTLPELLAQTKPDSAHAALGIDMYPARGDAPLDRSQPVLAQRQQGIITRQYCKLVSLRRPVRWANGYHRGKHTPIDILPGLLLFHLALIDRDLAVERAMERSSSPEDPSMAAHIAGRLSVIDALMNSQPLAFDAVAEKARDKIMVSLPSPTGPHPGRIDDGNVKQGYHVRLPARMLSLLPPLQPEGWRPQRLVARHPELALARSAAPAWHGVQDLIAHPARISGEVVPETAADSQVRVEIPAQ